MLDTYREGWVEMSLTVLANGRVTDVQVVDASDPDARFDEAALRSVSEWTYNPATLDGRPIDQRNMMLVLNFVMQNHPGVDKTIITAMKSIEKALDEGRLTEAEEGLRRLDDSRDLNLQAYSYLYMLWGRYHEQSEQPHEALLSYGRAARSAENAFAPKDRAPHLRSLIRMQILLGHLGAAVETGDKLVEAAGPLPTDDPLVGALQQVRTVLETGGTFEVEGKLVNRCRRLSACPQASGHWRYDLVRSNIQFEEAGPGIREVELACANKNATSPFEVGTAWAIPESWGACTMVVRGEPGAEFRFVQF